jgi:hypothetical protein
VNPAPGTPQQDPTTASAQDSRQHQCFGHVTPPEPPGTHSQTYLVRDDDTGLAYSFTYAEIVTEGLRTVRDGERVRFLIDPHDRRHATYVVRLDLPDLENLYGA